mmetsp:Transcript_74673/g.139410  ORF Transcript_74673/g.139410 Transcript_74673/m.139410 type:complete len:425 (-) Transcript_74673:156-1430(-)
MHAMAPPALQQHGSILAHSKIAGVAMRCAKSPARAQPKAALATASAPVITHRILCPETKPKPEVVAPSPDTRWRSPTRPQATVGALRSTTPTTPGPCFVSATAGQATCQQFRGRAAGLPCASSSPRRTMPGQALHIVALPPAPRPVQQLQQQYRERSVSPARVPCPTVARAVAPQHAWSRSQAGAADARFTPVAVVPPPEEAARDEPTACTKAPSVGQLKALPQFTPPSFWPLPIPEDPTASTDTNLNATTVLDSSTQSQTHTTLSRSLNPESGNRQEASSQQFQLLPRPTTSSHSSLGAMQGPRCRCGAHDRPRMEDKSCQTYGTMFTTHAAGRGDTPPRSHSVPVPARWIQVSNLNAEPCRAEAGHCDTFLWPFLQKAEARKVHHEIVAAGGVCDKELLGLGRSPSNVSSLCLSELDEEMED